MTKAELKWAVGCAAVLMAVTMIPYVAMWWVTPLHAFYPWTLFNGDDHAVYYSWMRQAQEGHLLFRNLYTVEPQRGIYLHLYFLLVGTLGRLPFGIEGADHLCRLFFGGLAMVLVYRLAAFFTADLFTRRVIFWTTAVSAGLGWLFWHNYITTQEPVDVWQSEAITFASLYTNGLFCVSLCLMLGVLICLLLADERGPRWAVGAGACGFLLANIHTYDLFHLAAAWGGYLLVRWIVERRFPAQAFLYALIAALVALPSFAYMAWYLKTEPIFAKRVQVGTFSGPLWTYLLGYGLLIPLAVWGARLLTRRETVEGGGASPHQRFLLPIVWSVTGVAVAYLPVAFQRKMIMGEHLALALLAGLAIAEIGRRVAKRYARPQLAGATAAVLIGLMAPSVVRFMIRDPYVGLTTGFDSTQVHPVYWDEDEIAAFTWMRKNTPPNARLMTYPLNGILAPAYSGRAVYSGHWGETPDFDQTLKIAIPFYWGTMDSANRLETLRAFGINYVLDSRMDRFYLDAVVTGGAARNGRVPPPRRPLAGEPFLLPVFHQGETTLYQVR